MGSVPEKPKEVKSFESEITSVSKQNSRTKSKSSKNSKEDDSVLHACTYCHEVVDAADLERHIYDCKKIPDDVKKEYSTCIDDLNPVEEDMSETDDKEIVASSTSKSRPDLDPDRNTAPNLRQERLITRRSKKPLTKEVDLAAMRELRSRAEIARALNRNWSRPIPRPTKRKRYRKRKSNEPYHLIPLKIRKYNPDRHCGVLTKDEKEPAELKPYPCPRTITCKHHKMALKRLVAGRSTTDITSLIKRHLERVRKQLTRRRLAQALKEGELSEIEFETDCKDEDEEDNCKELKLSPSPIETKTRGISEPADQKFWTGKLSEKNQFTASGIKACKVEAQPVAKSRNASSSFKRSHKIKPVHTSVLSDSNDLSQKTRREQVAMPTSSNYISDTNTGNKTETERSRNCRVTRSSTFTGDSQNLSRVHGTESSHSKDLSNTSSQDNETDYSKGSSSKTSHSLTNFTSQVKDSLRKSRNTQATESAKPNDTSHVSGSGSRNSKNDSFGSTRSRACETRHSKDCSNKTSPRFEDDSEQSSNYDSLKTSRSRPSEISHSRQTCRSRSTSREPATEFRHSKDRSRRISRGRPTRPRDFNDRSRRTSRSRAPSRDFKDRKTRTSRNPADLMLPKANLDPKPEARSFSDTLLSTSNTRKSNDDYAKHSSLKTSGSSNSEARRNANTSPNPNKGSKPDSSISSKPKITISRMPEAELPSNVSLRKNHMSQLSEFTTHKYSLHKTSSGQKIEISPLMGSTLKSSASRTDDYSEKISLKQDSLYETEPSNVKYSLQKIRRCRKPKPNPSKDLMSNMTERKYTGIEASSVIQSLLKPGQHNSGKKANKVSNQSSHKAKAKKIKSHELEFQLFGDTSHRSNASPVSQSYVPIQSLNNLGQEGMDSSAVPSTKGDDGSSGVGKYSDFDDTKKSSSESDDSSDDEPGQCPIKFASKNSRKSIPVHKVSPAFKPSSCASQNTCKETANLINTTCCTTRESNSKPFELATGFESPIATQIQGSSKQKDPSSKKSEKSDRSSSRKFNQGSEPRKSDSKKSHSSKKSKSKKPGDHSDWDTSDLYYFDMRVPDSYFLNENGMPKTPEPVNFRERTDAETTGTETQVPKSAVEHGTESEVLKLEHENTIEIPENYSSVLCTQSPVDQPSGTNHCHESQPLALGRPELPEVMTEPPVPNGELSPGPGEINVSPSVLQSQNEDDSVEGETWIDHSTKSPVYCRPFWQDSPIHGYFSLEDSPDPPSGVPGDRTVSPRPSDEAEESEDDVDIELVCLDDNDDCDNAANELEIPLAFGSTDFEVHTTLVSISPFLPVALNELRNTTPLDTQEAVNSLIEVMGASTEATISHNDSNDLGISPALFANVSDRNDDSFRKSISATTNISKIMEVSEHEREISGVEEVQVIVQIGKTLAATVPVPTPSGTAPSPQMLQIEWNTGVEVTSDLILNNSAPRCTTYFENPRVNWVVVATKDFHVDKNGKATMDLTSEEDDGSIASPGMESPVASYSASPAENSDAPVSNKAPLSNSENTSAVEYAMSNSSNAAFLEPRSPEVICLSDNPEEMSGQFFNGDPASESPLLAGNHASTFSPRQIAHAPSSNTIAEDKTTSQTFQAEYDKFFSVFLNEVYDSHMQTPTVSPITRPTLQVLSPEIQENAISGGMIDAEYPRDNITISVSNTALNSFQEQPILSPMPRTVPVLTARPESPTTSKPFGQNRTNIEYFRSVQNHQLYLRKLKEKVQGLRPIQSKFDPAPENSKNKTRRHRNWSLTWALPKNILKKRVRKKKQLLQTVLKKEKADKAAAKKKKALNTQKKSAQKNPISPEVVLNPLIFNPPMTARPAYEERPMSPETARRNDRELLRMLTEHTQSPEYQLLMAKASKPKPLTFEAFQKPRLNFIREQPTVTTVGMFTQSQPSSDLSRIYRAAYSNSNPGTVVSPAQPYADQMCYTSGSSPNSDTSLGYQDVPLMATPFNEYLVRSSPEIASTTFENSYQSNSPSSYTSETMPFGNYQETGPSSYGDFNVNDPYQSSVTTPSNFGTSSESYAAYTPCSPDAEMYSNIGFQFQDSPQVMGVVPENLNQEFAQNIDAEATGNYNQTINQGSIMFNNASNTDFANSALLSALNSAPLNRSPGKMRSFKSKNASAWKRSFIATSQDRLSSTMMLHAANGYTNTVTAIPATTQPIVSASPMRPTYEMYSDWNATRFHSSMNLTAQGYQVTSNILDSYNLNSENPGNNQQTSFVTASAATSQIIYDNGIGTNQEIQGSHVDVGVSSSATAWLAPQTASMQASGSSEFTGNWSDGPMLTQEEIFDAIDANFNLTGSQLFQAVLNE